MIDSLFLANLVQNRLNENNLGIEFLIYSDEGELVKNTKIGASIQKYTQGLIEIVSDNLIPIKANSLVFQTITTQLMIFVDLADSGFVDELGRKQSQHFIDVKNILEKIIEDFNGATIPIVDDNKTYTVSLSFSKPKPGQKTSLGDISQGLPLYMNITFAFFQNGVNANDCNIIINNENLYFTRFVISKIKQADQSQFANSDGAKTYALIGGKSLDMVIPVVNSPVNKLMMQDILEDDILNNALFVRIETPLYNKNFIGIFGTIGVNADVNSNLGYNVAVVEGVSNILNYSDDWIIEKTTEKSVTKILTAKGCVFWGDGSSDYVETRKTITHIYNDNLENHTIRQYKGV